MVVIILRKLGALSKIAFFSQYFWCFLWKEGAVVIPGRSVGKTNVQYRGLIRPTVPLHRSTLPQTCFSICSLSWTILSPPHPIFKSQHTYFSFCPMIMYGSWSAREEEKEKADDVSSQARQELNPSQCCPIFASWREPQEVEDTCISGDFFKGSAEQIIRIIS